MNRVLNPSVSVKTDFTKIPNYLLKNKKVKLNDSQARFLMYIFGNVYSKTGCAELSFADITNDLGYSKNKISKLRKELIHFGLIETVCTRTKGNGYGPTLYYLKEVNNYESDLEENQIQNLKNLVPPASPALEQTCIGEITNLVINLEQYPCIEFDANQLNESSNETSFEGLPKEEQQIQEEFEKEQQQEQNVVVASKNLDNTGDSNFEPDLLLNNSNIYRNMVNSIIPYSDNGNIDKVIDELKKLHITEKSVNKIISTYKPPIILEYINYVYYLLQNKKIHNPAAFLVRAINDNYDISNYKSIVDKEKNKVDYSKKQSKIAEYENAINQENKRQREKLHLAVELYEKLSENSKNLLDKQLDEIVTNKHGMIFYGKGLLKQIELVELLEQCDWDIDKLLLSPAKY